MQRCLGFALIVVLLSSASAAPVSGAPTAQAEADTLELRSGERRSVTVERIDSDQLVLSSGSLERAAVTWIAFGAPEPAQPLPLPSPLDLALLRDGQLLEGRLLVLDRDQLTFSESGAATRVIEFGALAAIGFCEPPCIVGEPGLTGQTNGEQGASPDPPPGDPADAETAPETGSAPAEPEPGDPGSASAQPAGRPSWLDPGQSCPSVADTQSLSFGEPLGEGRVRCVLQFSICGEEFEKSRTINTRAAETCPLSLHYSAVPRIQICCTAWRQARETRQPCDPGVDADCDGVPNDQDDAPLDPARSRIGGAPPGLSDLVGLGAIERAAPPWLRPCTI